jgi:hypothetical protein
MNDENAYEVLAKHFGCSSAYIEIVLEAHFTTPSTAGSEHLAQPHHEHEQDTPVSTTWTMDEIRDSLALIDRLRAQGLIKPLTRYITMSSLRTDKKGKYYYASDEQLQQELTLQRNSSIDPDGNLVQDGQIVKYGWLQSFAKKDYE